MTIKTALASTVAAFVLASGAFAQTAPAPQTPQNQQRPAQPTAPAAPAPAQTAPRTTAPAAPAPAATTTAPAQRPAQQGQLVNLNTAPESDLDKLPQIGPARAKAIVENRTKNGRFKDWNDFVARGVIPSNAEAAIKDKVRF
jgi:DNA uptake protein ComE-like DNA-binding protein